jgi:hypothetical protein
MAGNAGTPVIRLARLATITACGQKVFIAPMTPLTAAEAAALEHQYPFLKSHLEQRPPQKLTLALFGNRETSFASPADIESGQQTIFDGAHSILGLDGTGPPLRVVMVIPDGVEQVAFYLPRQAYTGAIAYPAPETITVAVHDNIAAFEIDRYIDQDHWSRIGMIWYAPSGAIVTRIGDFRQLSTVRPDPHLSYTVRTQPPSKWDSPRRGQIASTQITAQRWCPGTYRVSVAPAARANRPFSTASFTVHR